MAFSTCLFLWLFLWLFWGFLQTWTHLFQALTVDQKMVNACGQENLWRLASSSSLSVQVLGIKTCGIMSRTECYIIDFTMHIVNFIFLQICSQCNATIVSVRKSLSEVILKLRFLLVLIGAVFRLCLATEEHPWMVPFSNRNITNLIFGNWECSGSSLLHSPFNNRVLFLALLICYLQVGCLAIDNIFRFWLHAKSQCLFRGVWSPSQPRLFCHFHCFISQEFPYKIIFVLDNLLSKKQYTWHVQDSNFL
mgnify:CR=1 FL=1